MTYNEAIAALAIAPCDNKLSRVNGAFTRGAMVQMVRDELEAIGKVITFSPALAHRVAQVVQDWPDPVPLRFNYQCGWDDEKASWEQVPKIAVGWNKEELNLRIQQSQEEKKPKFVSSWNPGPDLTAYESPLAAKMDELAKQMAFKAQRDHVAELYEMLGPPPKKKVKFSFADLAAKPAITLTHFELQDMMAAEDAKLAALAAQQEHFNETANKAKLETLRAEAEMQELINRKKRLHLEKQLGMKSEDASCPPEPEEEKKPEPKPDPSSPTFVLKRPKPA